MTDRIGFVGLGVMGSAMASNLSDAGFDVTGFDIDPAALERAPATVARAGSIKTVVADADVLAMSLSGPAACRAVVADLVALDVAVRVLDLSTIDPRTAGELETELGRHGIGYIHAPVIGGQVGAVAGTLTIIAGGEKATLERVEPLLGAIGSTIHRVDSPRTAALLKLLNNLTSLGNTVVFAEAFALAAAAEVDAQTVFDVLNTGSAASAALERRWRVNIAPGDYRPGFAVDLAVKDLDLAVKAATELGLDLPTGQATRDTFARLSAAGMGNDDVAALVRVWEERVGHRIGGAAT